jgi:2'-5' RNA ligase superfamily protein
MFHKFSGIRFFAAHDRRLPGGVLYFAPQPDEPFRRLILAVWDCFPETPPYGGRYSSVVPHLTLARLASEQQADQVAAEITQASRGQLPICATASEIALMDTLSGSWQVRTTILLG